MRRKSSVHFRGRREGRSCQTEKDVQFNLMGWVGGLSALTMMTALRRRDGLHRCVAEGRFVGEIPSKQIRAGASKCIPGCSWVMGAWG